MGMTAMTQLTHGEEAIEVDRGGCRFTHIPSGDTLVRHDYFHQRAMVDAWTDKMKAFLAAHPQAVSLVSRTGEHSGFSVIGDVRDFPWQEGFAVGDNVVTISRGDYEVDCCRQIVGVVAGAYQPLSKNELGHHYLLEDGQPLYWASTYDCWHSTSKDGRGETRSRRLYAGEDAERLRISEIEILQNAFMSVANALDGGSHYAMVPEARRQLQEMSDMADEEASSRLRSA